MPFMKKVRKSILLLTILMFLLSCLPSFVHAQSPGDPYCDPLCNCRKDGSVCPIDNGVYALLALGVLYGIKKVKDARAPKEVN